METILLGIIATHVAEVVTALNKKLSGTIFKGDGAFLIAVGISLLVAIYQVATTPGVHISSLQDMTATFGQVFAASQVYFWLVVQKLNLDVQPDAKSVPITVSPALQNIGASTSSPAAPLTTVAPGSSTTIPGIQRLS